MLDEVSLDRQLLREADFSPPFCPRPKCRNHLPSLARKGFWHKHGMVALKRFPYVAQRFQCKDCSASFSASFFQLHYRQKIWGHNKLIWEYHQIGASKRATARKVGHSERLIRTRLRNMARFAELKHAQLTERLRVEEEIVYDGLENFSYSQYDPNNINHAVGKRSLFIYDFNLAPLNRKGRMSPWQIRKKRILENRHGEYPKDAIRTTTRRLFERLLKRTNALTLYSDRHFQYAKVVGEDLRNESIRHLKVSSKIFRNFRNPLFAVNNVDLQARHCLAAFKRETIAFSKHEVAMQDSFLLYAIGRNYLRPKFYGTHRSDPESSKKSPAMELRVTSKILSFDEFFRDRALPSQVTLNEHALARYERRMSFSRRVIAPASSI